MEMIVLRPVKAAGRLTVRQLQVLKSISKALGDKPGRVDYEKIGKGIGMTEGGVRYAVGALLRAQILSFENGNLKVQQRIVL